MGVLDALFGGNTGVLDAIIKGGAGGPVGPGSTLVDEIDKRRERAGFTPGFNPNAEEPFDIFKAAQQGNFGAGKTPTRKQVAAVSTAKDPSLANLLLSKLGGPGRKLMPVSNFLGEVGNALEGAARRGGLGSLAPNFQAGVLNADKADLNRRFIEAQIARMTAPDVQNAPKPHTDIGKLVADHEAGFLTDEQFADQIGSIDTESRTARLEATSKLRGEYNTNTQDVRTSISDLAKAKALVDQGNPIAATAAFTAFIRSIDNSVVRPAEQAAYSSAGGLARRLQDELSKLQGKGPLSDDTRRDLLSSIEIIENQLGGVLDRTAQFYGGLANNAKLDPAEVTGLPINKSEKGKITDTELDSDTVLQNINDQIEEAQRQLDRLENGNQAGN